MRQLYLLLDDGEWLLLDALDDTDGDGGPHVSDGETTKWSVLEESLNNKWLCWNHLDNSTGIPFTCYVYSQYDFVINLMLLQHR